MWEKTGYIKNKICTLCSKISMRSFVFFALICTMIVIGNVIFDVKAMIMDNSKKLWLGKNIIFLVMSFLGYNVCIWKKRKNKHDKMNTGKKIGVSVLIFIYLCLIYIGILFFMFGASAGTIEMREKEDILLGSCFLLVAVFVGIVLLNWLVYLWYPISSFCALYAWQIGDYIGGFEGVGMTVALLGGVILFGIIEYSITVFLNLGIPKWIWKYVCGLVLFIILVLLHFV